MKKWPLFLSLSFLLVQCNTMKKYNTLDADPHPSYIHAMEQFLAADMNSEDSATSAWAKEFMRDFETGFKAYKPYISVIKKLENHLKTAEIKVIGGNWCSDTRFQVPRLAKVLYYAGLPVEKFSYFRVNKAKQAVDADFAAEIKPARVPEIVVFNQGKEVGRITETPQESMEKDLLKLLDK